MDAIVPTTAPITIVPPTMAPMTIVIPTTEPTNQAVEANRASMDDLVADDTRPIQSFPGRPIASATTTAVRPVPYRPQDNTTQTRHDVNEMAGAIPGTTTPLPHDSSMATSPSVHEANKVTELAAKDGPSTPSPCVPSSVTTELRKKRYMRTQKMLAGTAKTARYEVHSPR
jgi:hypothetical protein